MSVYSASPLYIPRIRRVSSPELARELAGPQASTSVTPAPRLTSESAAHPPNAPAPTTITRTDGDDMRLSAVQPFSGLPLPIPGGGDLGMWMTPERCPGRRLPASYSLFFVTSRTRAPVLLV